MKKNIGLVLVLVLVGVMIYSYVKKETTAQNAIAHLGYEQEVDEQLAPNFTLQTLAGDEVTLDNLKGKKVILNFWATWCPPCRTEMPHLQQYYEQFRDKDNVEIIAVNATYRETDTKHVQSFIDSFDLTFPVALATDDQVFDAYKIITIPSTFFIDTKGRVQYQIVGPLDEKMVRDYVGKLN